MKRDSKQFKTLLLSFMALVIVSAQASVIYVGASVSPQGKGGEIKPLPTPTPATKKTTPAKKSSTPARTNPTGASKQPARKAEPVPATNPAVEVAFWETIKTSTNPEDFREYLKKYPNGEFAGLARNRLNALETAAKEEAARKEEAAKKRPGAVVKNNIGMELVYIPAGNFMMGATDEPKGFASPVHQVTIREGFYMGRYELTIADWRAVMGDIPEGMKGINNLWKESERQPVVRVSWMDTQEFIRRLNARGDGYTYRLPSEAEWEYACRAGTTTHFAFGPTLSSDQANYDGTIPMGEAAKGVSRQKPMPVGSFQPNAFGLYDMHGNVREWCQDWTHDSYNGAPNDGSAWERDGGQTRIQRGGGWIDFWQHLVSWVRSFGRPDQRSGDTGFRVVAVPRTQ